jgi:hypothetical protein
VENFPAKKISEGRRALKPDPAFIAAPEVVQKPSVHPG